MSISLRNPISAQHFTLPYVLAIQAGMLILFLSIFLSQLTLSAAGADITQLKKMLQRGKIAEAADILIPKVASGNLGAATMYYIICNGSQIENCQKLNALKALRSAADSGHPPAIHYLNLYHYRTAQSVAAKNKALKNLRQNFSNGYAASGTLLGDLSMDEGSQQAISKAVEYYQLASNIGDSEAEFKLGVLSELGRGLPKDMGKAISHYQTAAKRGSENAENALAIAYQVGKSVPRDRARAVQLYRQAAKKGHTGAQYNLADLLLSGKKPELDFFESTLWLKRAAAAGHLDAQDRLATAYKNGEGVKQDFTLAERWYLTAAGRGHPDAKYSLGMLYSNLTPGFRRPKASRKWLELAMKDGLPEAYIQMGKYYLYGNASVAVASKRNPDEAQRLFAIAEQLGGDLQIEASEWKEYAASRRRIVGNKLSTTEMAIMAIIGLGILGAMAGNGGGQSTGSTIMDNCPGMSSGGFGMACNSATDSMITGAMIGLF